MEGVYLNHFSDEPLPFFVVFNIEGNNYQEDLMKRLILPSLVVALTSRGEAQDVLNVMPGSTAVLFSGPQFFMSVLAGLVLAIGFQFLLTTLSIAGGVSALGSVTRPNKGGSNKNGISPNELAGTFRKINTGFGLWTMITASVALFFASWMAVELSITESLAAGAILGMVIWGLFYLVMTSLEVTALSSLIGSLFRTATAGLKQSFQTVSSLFSKSSEAQIADSAQGIARAVRQEFFGDAKGDDLRKQLTKYLDRSTANLDPARIRKELAQLLEHTEIEAVSAEGNWDKVVASFRNKSALSPEKMKSYGGVLKEAFSTIKEEMASGKDRPTKAADAALRVAGLSPQEAQAVKQKVADYLKKTGKEQLKPEAIKHDFEQLLSDPKAGKEAFKSKLSQIDRSTIAAFLAERQDLSRDEVERMIDRVNEVIQQLNRSLGRGPAEPHAQSIRDRAIGKIENYLNALDRPELRFEDLESDLKRLFSDPNTELKDISNRLKSMDRNTIKALIGSKKNISNEDAERMIQRVEATRDQFLQKIDQIKAEVEKRTEAAKEQTRKAAEESRRVAATAAWWAFGTAVISAICAVLGGITAVRTGGGGL